MPMMFSSNQKFDVTCELEGLEEVIAFAVKASGCLECLTRYDRRVRPAFQATLTGLYCIGLGSVHAAGESEAPEGWTDFPFDYDPAILAPIVAQWVRSQPKPEPSGTDGTERLGVEVAHPNDLPGIFRAWQGGIKGPLNCILTFRPYAVGYDK